MISDFLEESYISTLIENNYKEVEYIDLPDGEYYKFSGGYEFSIHVSSVGPTFDSYTGYHVITKDGIRGSWNGNKFVIKNGLPVGENIYKILTNRLDIIREKKLNELLK